MRICLVTPAHLSANPRLIKEADALSEDGHEVIVIAATYTAWGREADKTFSARPWRVAEPAPFGPSAPRGRRFVQLARFLGARRLVRLGARYPAIVEAAWRQVAPDLSSAAKKVRADLYIAHYPAALPAAARAARLHGAVYAFDAEDFHLGDPPDGPGGDHERLLTEKIERPRLPGCAYVTAASPGIADAYANFYSIERPTVVLNVFPRSQGPSAVTAFGSSPLKPSVYWFSQTIGPNRGLETAVRAIALAQSCPHLFLRGAPTPGYVSRLTALAESEGVTGRVHLLPPADPADMERLAAAYDIGLSAEPGHSLNNRLALGNKLFSYLLAGLPTVASDGPAHRQFAPDAPVAFRLFATENAASLAEAIDGLLSSAETLQTARAAAFRLGQERFNWDIEKAVLLSCVNQAFRHHLRAAQ